MTVLKVARKSIGERVKHIKLKVKIDMHIEQCNIIVIIKYEIKSMKTLEDTIS